MRDRPFKIFHPWLPHIQLISWLRNCGCQENISILLSCHLSWEERAVLSNPGGMVATGPDKAPGEQAGCAQKGQGGSSQGGGRGHPNTHRGQRTGLAARACAKGLADSVHEISSKCLQCLCVPLSFLIDNNVKPYNHLFSEHLRENPPWIWSPVTMFLIFPPQWLYSFQDLKGFTGTLFTLSQ